MYTLKYPNICIINVEKSNYLKVLNQIYTKYKAKWSEILSPEFIREANSHMPEEIIGQDQKAMVLLIYDDKDNCYYLNCGLINLTNDFINHFKNGIFLIDANNFIEEEHEIN